MIIKWKDEYTCYDPVIDEQHARLIELINEMNEVSKLVEDGIDSYDDIVKIFDELRDYAVYHFSTEEKMFEDHGYDSFNIRVQKIEHENFKNKVAAIDMYDLDENQDETVNSILEFLSRWLEHHILKIDKKFGEFLLEKKENE